MNRNQLSRRTLERLPGRVLKFLTALGKYKVIRALLTARGYSDQEHALGWALLHKHAHFQPSAAAGGDSTPTADDKVSSAIAELDNWDEPNFETILAILERFFPEVAAFLFKDLKPAQGAAAVLSVGTLLARIKSLTSGDERKETRKQDKAALDLLAKRGYTKETWDHLAALVDIATKGAPVPESTVEQAEARNKDANSETPLDPAEEQILVELYKWYRDWSTTASNHIKRRQYLIRLDLASPRTRKKSKKDKDADTAGADDPK